LCAKQKHKQPPALSRNIRVGHNATVAQINGIKASILAAAQTLEINYKYVCICEHQTHTHTMQPKTAITPIFQLGQFLFHMLSQTPK